MPNFNPDPDTEKLSKDEKKWCRQLENLLLKTPERFGLYTTGDSGVSVFDRVACEDRGLEPDSENFPTDLDLAYIQGSEDIQAWAG